MNQSDSIHPDTDKLVDPSARPGQRLRTQRESRGIGIERIAAQLHLRREVVEALEQDRYEALPAPVFVTGYLNNYARLLGIDSQSIVQSFRDSLSPIEPPIPHAMSAPPRSVHAGGLWVSLISLALIGAVIAMVVLWWQDRARLDPGFASDSAPALFGQTLPAADSETERPLDQTSAVALDSPTDPSLEPAAADQPPPAETAASTAAPAVGPVMPPSAPATAPPASRQPVPDSPPVPSSLPPETASPPVQIAEDAAPLDEAATAEIVLEFSGASWVTVRGSDGKVVLNGEMRDGDRRVLDGQPPYQFVIGNAAATRMTVGGEPFDVVNRSRGNVARFSLDPTVE